MCKPDIYLFDDAFSALDLPPTPAARRAAAGHRARDRLIVAQRVSTIIDADHIVVLEDGRVVGRGRTTSCSTRCETYQEIVESQHSAEEAA